MILTARLAGMVSLIWMLASCALPSDGPPTADQAARAACRAQAEQTSDVQTRSTRYQPDYGRDAPLSGQSSPEISRGLADRYSYEQDYQDCLRSRGARQTPTSLPSATTPPAPRSPSSGVPSLLPGTPSPPPTSSDLTRPPALTP